MPCMLEKKKYILLTFQNTNQSMKKQVTLLMISNGQGQHNIAVKTLSAVLTVNLLLFFNVNHSEIIAILLLEFSSFVQTNKIYLNYIKSYTEIKSFVLPSGDTRILELNQKQNYDKIPFIIYADLESLIEIMDGRKSNPEKLSTTKVGKHVIHTL